MKNVSSGVIMKRLEAQLHYPLTAYIGISAVSHPLISIRRGVGGNGLTAIRGKGGDQTGRS